MENLFDNQWAIGCRAGQIEPCVGCNAQVNLHCKLLVVSATEVEQPEQSLLGFHVQKSQNMCFAITQRIFLALFCRSRYLIQVVQPAITRSEINF